MRKMNLLAAALMCWPLMAAPAHAQDEAAPVTSTTASAEAPAAPDIAKRDEMRAKWKAMTPEQREAKRAEMKAKFEAMTPEQKEQFKKDHPRFGGRHDGKGGEMRAKWKAMTPEQREAKRAEMKAKWDAMTPEQKEQFKKDHPKANHRFYKHEKKDGATDAPVSGAPAADKAE